MAQYTVAPGDTLVAIAQCYGMSGLELYEHPNNQGLRKQRPNPDRIVPGDVVWVPDAQTGPQLRYVVSKSHKKRERSRRINPLLLHGDPNLVHYKVHTGDTLESLAEHCGCTWQTLARLNWLTDDPQEINWYLGHYFVCKHKRDGNYIFTSEDEPGILLLPPVVDLSTGRKRHTVRASRFTDE